jgi:hypothetical protein
MYTIVLLTATALARHVSKKAWKTAPLFQEGRIMILGVTMDEGSERDKTWGGGPTYAARSLPQYNSAFATRVLLSTYVCVKGEKA